MPLELSRTFRERLRSAEAALAHISETDAGAPYRPGGWIRKEVLGHLIDSAVNNHVRFAATAAGGSYAAPGYAQNAWVELHGYRALPWATLLEQWRIRNWWLAHLVERLPDASLDGTCRIGDGQPVTLRFLIEDYLRHLDHHVEQMI